MSRRLGLSLPANYTAVEAKRRESADRLRAQLGGEEPRWYRISNATADEAEVMLYDEIGGWFGAMADEFIDELKAITAPRMRVRVNSPGGGVFEGVAIANALRAHPAEVTVQIDGLAASIASVIAMAGDRVVIAPQAMVMIHDASGGCLGNSADMQEMADLLDKISDNIADAYATRAGGNRDDWRAKMRAESWYTADEAVAAGLADEVMPQPKKRAAEPDEAEPEMRRRYDLTAYGYQGPPQKTEPNLTFNLGEEFGAQLLAALRTATGQGAPEVRNVMRQFDEGDLVRVVGQPHEPGHSQGRVAVVNGNAYGIIFDTPDDDTMPGEPYLWYVDNELEFVAEGPDRAGEGDGDGEDEPAEAPQAPAYAPASEPDDDAEELRPGVSHPMGRPVPTGQADAGPAAAAEPVDAWAALTAHLTKDEPDAWSVLVSHLTTTASSSAATEA